MNKKTDLRILKTKKALYEALVELIKDKSFEEIRASDLCSKALINRSTFYSHFSDKYDLVASFIDDLKKELLNALSKNKNIINTKEFYIEMINLILEHIDSKKNIYKSILKFNRNSIIIDMIIDVTIKDLNKRLEISTSSNNSIPIDILTTFYLSGVSGVILEWLNGNDKYEKKDIIKYLDKLIPDDINE